MKLVVSWIGVCFTLGTKPFIHEALFFFADGDHNPLKAYILNLLPSKVAIFLSLWFMQLSLQCMSKCYLVLVKEVTPQRRGV